MAFTKITNAELNSRGATTLPNVPTIGATALKQEFDAPAKQVVAPKVNNLIDELQASTAAEDLGAVAPTGRTGTSVQSVLNSISSDLGTAEAQSHAHPNKAVIDKFADDGTGLTYDGNPIRGAVESVNGKDGTVVLTASDVGALPSTTPIPTKTSDLTNDSGFITASSLPTKTSQLTNDSGFITSGDIPTIPTKTSDLTNDSNFVADSSYVHTDNNYDATAKGIVDGATAAIAAKSTVAWNQNITTGQKIATVTIDGTPTDVYAPTGGGGGGGAVDSVNGQTGIVTLGVGDLDDVSISSLASQQTIVYDGTEWGNEALADVALSGAYADLSGQPTLATVATSGAYADLTGQPTIPTITDTYSATSSNGMSGKAVAQAIASIHGGGMLPYLYIDSEAGATVTVVQPDSTTITPTAAGSGHWECELTGGYGTYVIHSVLSGQGDVTLSLAVDTVKEYHVTDTHYDYTINVTAPSGSTVRIVGGGETYTGTGTGTAQAFAVHTPSTVYTITATQIMDGNTKTDEATVTSAATSGGSTNVTLSIEFGTINVSVAADFVTAGSTITCVKTGVNTISKTAASTLTFRVPETGEYTISGTLSGTPYSTTATVISLSTPESVDLRTGAPMYSFETATDAQLAAMLESYYDGSYNAADIATLKSTYMPIGAKRSISLSAMTATGVSESHHADNYDVVIIGHEHDDLKIPSSGGKTKAFLTLQLDRILYKNTTDATYTSDYPAAADEGGYMNSTNTNVGGWTNCARRSWCNNVFFNALPTAIKNLVKTVNKLTSAGNQSTTIQTTEDDVFLLSEIEIFGAITKSKTGEGNQYEYFTIASNTQKKPSYQSYVSAYWWERSPDGSLVTYFCDVNNNGVAWSAYAKYTAGLAPAFCI